MKCTVEKTNKEKESIWITQEAHKELQAGSGSTIYINNYYPATVRSLENGSSNMKLSADIMNEMGIDDDRTTVTVSKDKSDTPITSYIKLLIPSELDIASNTINLVNQEIQKQVDNQTVRYDKLNVELNTISTVDGEVEFPILEMNPSVDTARITQDTQIEWAKQPQSDNDDYDIEPSDDYTESFGGIGGLDEEIKQVKEVVQLPIDNPELFDQMNVDPPTGILLHGPSGTGKTMIAEAVANETDANFYHIEGSEIVGKYRSDATDNLKKIFEECEPPAIIFIDEIDSLATSRESKNTRKMDERIVTTLLTQMDGLEADEDIFVIGATNRLDSLDPALRRGGRFDREIEIGVPDEDDRREIIEIYLENVPVSDEVTVEDILAKTNGFVGADIESLIQEAAMNSISRAEKQNIPTHSVKITESDIDEALKNVEPSAMREFHVEVPDVEWGDIGGLEEEKQNLISAVEYPLEFDEVYQQYDIDTNHGVLLEGPTGTGKTLLAKAAANESDANFISVKGPELFDKWVGESEEEIRRVFERARANSPTIIFFDEIDAVAKERGSNNTSSGVSERIVNQLLSEMDGVEENEEDIIVIGTTNHADAIDDAILRSGRLSETIHIGVPDIEARREIFEIELDEKPTTDDIDADELAEETEGYVGADISEIVRKASVDAATDVIDSDQNEIIPISHRDLLDAIEEVEPSV